MNKKGFVFIVDIIIGLLLIILLITNLNIYNQKVNNYKNINKIIISQKINDLLITSQILEIENLENLEINFKKLFPYNEGYIILNNQKKEFNNNYNNIINKYKNNNEKQLISNSIKYIKSSNYKIYIEIGIYY